MRQSATPTMASSRGAALPSGLPVQSRASPAGAEQKIHCEAVLGVLQQTLVFACTCSLSMSRPSHAAYSAISAAEKEGSQIGLCSPCYSIGSTFR